jgi:hypothetical protein
VRVLSCDGEEIWVVGRTVAVRMWADRAVWPWVRQGMYVLPLHTREEDGKMPWVSSLVKLVHLPIRRRGPPGGHPEAASGTSAVGIFR